LKSVYPDVKDISVSQDNLAGQPAYRNEHMTWMLDHWQKSISLFTINNGQLFEVSILAEPKEVEKYYNDINKIIQSVEFSEPTTTPTQLVKDTVLTNEESLETEGLEDTEPQELDCDSSYPDFCIPPAPPNLNCPDISQKRFAVTGSDPHGFDRDNDGIGCES